MNETQLTAKIKSALKKRGAYVEKIWVGGFQSAGIPDLICCYNGRFLAFEVKVDNNKASELQLAKILQINNAGGVAVVVRSVEEVIHVLNVVDRYGGVNCDCVRQAIQVPTDNRR